MKRLRSLALLSALAVTASLPGCGGTLSTASETVGQNTIGAQTLEGAAWFAALSVTSVIITDKTLVDHIVSLAYGKDCSTVRYLDGDYYCKRPPKPQPPLYCYPSLGDIVCYREPNPYGQQDAVDWPPTRSAPPASRS
jgi:hypothetical protein